MALVEFKEISEFQDACLQLMPSEEEHSSLLYATATQISEGNPLYIPPFCMLGTKSKSGSINGLALYAEPDGLLLSRLTDEQLREICIHTNRAIGKPKRIMGPESSVDLARQYFTTEKQITQWSCDVLNILRITNQELIVREAPGKLRLFHKHDEKAVRELSAKYEEENNIFINVEEYMMRRAENGRLFLWDDEGVQVMLALSTRVFGGVRIGGVYTLDASRGRGYAGAAISSLLVLLFGEGLSTVRLHARHGSVAVRLYEKLGFREVDKVAIATLNSRAD